MGAGGSSGDIKSAEYVAKGHTLLMSSNPGGHDYDWETVRPDLGDFPGAIRNLGALVGNRATLKSTFGVDASASPVEPDSNVRVAGDSTETTITYPNIDDPRDISFKLTNFVSGPEYLGYQVGLEVLKSVEATFESVKSGVVNQMSAAYGEGFDVTRFKAKEVFNSLASLVTKATSEAAEAIASQSFELGGAKANTLDGSASTTSLANTNSIIASLSTKVEASLVSLLGGDAEDSLALTTTELMTTVTSDALAEAVALLDGPDLQADVEAFRREAKKTLLQSTRRFTGGLAAIGATQTTAFTWGLALLESDHLAEVNKYQAQQRLTLKMNFINTYINTFTASLNQYLQNFTQQLLSELASVKGDSAIAKEIALSFAAHHTANFQGLFDAQAKIQNTHDIAEVDGRNHFASIAAQAGLNAIQTDYTHDENRAKLQADMIRLKAGGLAEYERGKNALTKDVHLFKQKAYGYGAQILSAASSGSAFIPNEPSQASQAFSGALSGAGVGFAIGGPAGAGIGAIVGAGAGLS